MMVIHVDGTRVCIENYQPFVQGTVGLQANVQLSEEWDGLTVTAVFATADNFDTRYPVSTGSGTITIPWEVLSEARAYPLLSFDGRDSGGNLIRRSSICDLGEVAPSMDPLGETPTPTPPYPDWYENVYEAGQQALQSAQDAEAYAKGTRGGTEVGTTDPAYHNNAKYFKEQAEAVRDSIPADYTELAGDVSELKSAVDNVEAVTCSAEYEEIQVTTSTGSRYVRFSGDAWNEVTNNANFHTMEFAANPSTTYKITDASSYSPYVPSVIFYDANGNILGSTEIPLEQTWKATRIFEQYVTTPAGCAKILTNNFGAVPYAYESAVYEQTLINKYEKQIEVNTSLKRNAEYATPAGTETGAISLLNGSYVLRNTGAFASWNVVKIDVTPGEKWHVRGTYYHNTPVAAFMKNNAVISVIGDKQSNTNWATRIWEYDVTVPDNVDQIWINKFTSSDATTAIAYKYEVAPASTWVGKKWACIGDSLTEYNYTSYKKYMDFIQEQTGITIENMGIGGTGYKNQGSSQTAFYERVSDVPEDADVITIFGSGNDLSYTLGEVMDSTTDTICGCINKTIDDLYTKYPLAKLGIISPCPWGSYPTNTDNAMAKYSAALKEICEMRGIPFLDLYRCSGFRPWNDTFKSLVYTFSNDGVHPNNIGQEMLASHIYEFVRTIIM